MHQAHLWVSINYMKRNYLLRYIWNLHWFAGGYFKDRYTGHKYTFKHVNKKNSTKLSDFVWQYFDRYGTKPEMEWSILRHANNNISSASKTCQICNIERIAIVAENSNQILNKRRDISNNCVHNRRFYFKWYLGAFSTFIYLSHEHTNTHYIYIVIVVYPKLLHCFFIHLFLYTSLFVL